MGGIGPVLPRRVARGSALASRKAGGGDLLANAQPRADFASDEAYRKYLNGLARIVWLAFSQSWFAKKSMDTKSGPLNNPPKGDQATEP